MMNAKDKLMVTIGFLNWAQISPEDVRGALCNPSFKGRVFISPDVHSLHLVWDEPGDETVSHEIADYPYDDEVTVEEFLNDEVLQDSSYLYEDGRDIWEVISDYREQTEENTPIVTITYLESGEGPYNVPSLNHERAKRH